MYDDSQGVFGSRSAYSLFYINDRTWDEILANDFNYQIPLFAEDCPSEYHILVPNQIRNQIHHENNLLLQKIDIDSI